MKIDGTKAKIRKLCRVNTLSTMDTLISEQNKLFP